MNIVEIYKKYQIMPQLAEHQLTVAAVADIICERIDLPINKFDIIAACLLHDMGNIIKFDLARTKSLVNTDIDLGYWQKIKDDFKKRYGPDEHRASIVIAKELGVSNRVIELVDCVGFTTAKTNSVSSDFGKKICGYADAPVDPWGVVSLKERFADLRRRYSHHQKDSPERGIYEQSMLEIEGQIFAHANIKPEDITEAAIVGRRGQLRNFEI